MKENGMDIWLAFSSFEEMERAHDYPIRGVLTNPTVLTLPQLPWKETIKRLDEVGTLPLGLQVVSTVEKDMIGEIEAYHGMIRSKELIIKLPFCVNAMKIMPFIKRLGHDVNMAAVCTFSQAVIALEAEPDYLSLYVGRVDDSGGNGIQLLGEIKRYAQAAGKQTVIQAASIRTLEQFDDAARCGADAVVISFSVLREAAESEMTAQSIEKFAEDWATISQ
jgi:TalC/MipB family fructose-6-phosphate aldolase